MWFFLTCSFSQHKVNSCYHKEYSAINSLQREPPLSSFLLTSKDFCAGHRRIRCSNCTENKLNSPLSVNKHISESFPCNFSPRQRNHLFEKVKKGIWNLWMINAIYLVLSLNVVVSKSSLPLLTQECISCTVKIISMANNIFSYEFISSVYSPSKAQNVGAIWILIIEIKHLPAQSRGTGGFLQKKRKKKEKNKPLHTWY